MNASIKKGMSIILNILLWLIILVVAVFIVLKLSTKQNDGIPKFFGYSPLTILSDSMKGSQKDNFTKGDLIVIHTVDAKKLKEKQIITFWDIINGEKAPNTHRIIKIETINGTTYFTTKGDNKPLPDTDLKTSNDIIGKYQFRLKGMGNVMSFLQSKWGFLCCLVLPLFLFFVWRLIKLVMAVVDYQKYKNIETVEGDPENIQMPIPDTEKTEPELPVTSGTEKSNSD